jgi:hypothetical protein
MYYSHRREILKSYEIKRIRKVETLYKLLFSLKDLVRILKRDALVRRTDDHGHRCR